MKERVRFYKKIKPKFKIYLDLNYWILLCDNHLGKPFSNAKEEICQKLINIGSHADVIFPISETIFREILKQTDPTSRTKTAELVEVYSNNVAIIPGLLRSPRDFEYFLSGVDVDSPDSLWHFDAIGYSGEIYGEGRLKFPDGWAEDDKDVMDKMMYDLLRRFSFRDTVELYADDNLYNVGLDPSHLMYERIKKGNFENKSDIPNFNTAYFIELRGCISTHLERRGMPKEHVDWLSRSLTLNALQRFLTHEKTLHLAADRILSGLYAKMRFETHRILTPNDLYDFYHAVDALPTCDAFLTDRAFALILKSKELKLHDIFDCAVVAGEKEVLEYLVDVEARYSQ
jgi:hypothetical protein